MATNNVMKVDCVFVILILIPPRPASGAVRASSIFPILSVILLFMGGLCIAASEFYKSRHNIILSAGIFFVSAGQFFLLPTSCFLPPHSIFQDVK